MANIKKESDSILKAGLAIQLYEPLKVRINKKDKE
jgi:hypothetical protein